MWEPKRATPSMYRWMSNSPCSIKGGSKDHVPLDLSAEWMIKQSPMSVHSHMPVLTWLVVQIRVSCVVWKTSSRECNSWSAWDGSSNFYLGLKGLPQIKFQKNVQLSGKNYRIHKRKPCRERPYRSWKRIAFTLQFLALDNQEILFHAPIQSSIWSNFTETLFFKNNKNITTPLLSVFVPKEQAGSVTHKDSSSKGSVAANRHYLCCHRVGFWTAPCSLSPLSSPSASDHMHLSLYLFEWHTGWTEGLTVSKWDLIAEEMY